ncbi:uncharacterized protein BCR38DRAFT_346251 [Pseudomassariella vexata]|uniref:Cyanobacterial phytochrome B n=1 Tax=Pseudomassariella vexata TaxID=1141098 RepID=A0A1Y2DTV8_9PEZI|nr:uncharacterized protein BCR38DRAFT_346251 [Pseudomassariella vexata]ORY62609.1 hypothetical protein BCR38DRAFT_346251 [Pseudomassariella vexata]
MSHDGPIVPSSGAPSSWSASSDRQLGHGSGGSTADPGDRVYPIRSVISVNQSQPTPWMPRNSGEHEYFPRHETTWDGRHRPVNPRIESDMSQHIMRHADTVAPSTAASSTSPKGRERAWAQRKSTMASIGSPPLDPKVLSSASLVSDQTSERSLVSDTMGDNSSLHAFGNLPDSPTGYRTPGAPNENLFAVRFKHVMTDDGHAVITGRDGTLQRCEDEPIQTPGAVQGFGLLVALREENDGCFTVRLTSENSRAIIGYSPQQLFRLENFLDIFTEEQADNLLDHIDFIRDEDADPASNGPEVFSISMRPPKSTTTKLWCAMHIPSSHPDLVLCEFELEDDHAHPLRPADELTPSAPEDTLYQNPTLEEFNESTEVNSKPLRVLRSARKKRGEAGAMQVFDIMSQVQEQLASASNLEKFLKILVGIVKELTGFHRVMVYQFDSAFNGKVVTELVDPAQTRDLYKGLHFPASDIPKQARDLYKLNKVRLLYDRDLESSRIVCRTVEDLERPLDLSHAYLRAMSPIHLKYLGNMAVRASMSISINAFNELWGLIACHSYGRRGMRVAFPIRKMCRLIGDTASRNIERLSYASRLQARKLINTVPTDKNPSGYIIASSEDLLKLFDADFGMLSIKGETKILGKLEQSQEALAMLEYLRMRKFTSVMTTQDITEDFPDLSYPPGFTVIAGLLYVPLSVGGQDFIVLFRKGQVKEVKWAGNPYEKIVREGTSNYLEPRSSFQVWHETVLGKCREWSEEQIETAAVLCLVYGKFIEVWRQKEAALQSSRLTRLLLANSAHEVRTPLNAIINYLEIALEGTLDQETRDNLAKSHSASKSLIYVINDLLDLTNTEEGQELIKDEVMDLPICFREATDPFKVDAKRKGIGYEVIEHQGLPHFVHGDHRRVRQAIANVTANAVQHTTKGFVRVECYVVEVVESKIRIEIAVEDTGRGMSDEKLDALFRDLEQVSTDNMDDSTMDDEEEHTGESRTLGLGLAVVARIVRNMEGQLRLKSEEGIGSRFVIQVPFDLPSKDAIENFDAGLSSKHLESSHSSSASVTRTLPLPDIGEVMLVDRGGSTFHTNPPHGLTKAKSFDETVSVNSLKSTSSKVSGGSNKSDADRLIDAIQTPLSIGEPESQAVSLQRQGSVDKKHVASNNLASSVRSLASMTTKRPPKSEGLNTADRPHIPRRCTTPPSTTTNANLPVGFTYVQDTKTPIKPIKMPDDYADQPTMPQPSPSSRVLFEILDRSSKSTPHDGTSRTPNHQAPGSSGELQVLIAEDDPINMKILRKRLEKAGHHVTHAVNGEDCAAVYGGKSKDFDVILMDMQMPIVDGLASTKMIRALEKSDKHVGLSPLASRHGRVPIFAVSASLLEREKSIYVNAGFDGWILKPVDFKRLHTLLTGIFEDETRNSCLYVQGHWERGGWFERRTRPTLAPREINDDSTSEEITPTGLTGTQTSTNT